MHSCCLYYMQFYVVSVPLVPSNLSHVLSLDVTVDCVDCDIFWKNIHMLRCISTLLWSLSQQCRFIPEHTAWLNLTLLETRGHKHSLFYFVVSSALNMMLSHFVDQHAPVHSSALKLIFCDVESIRISQLITFTAGWLHSCYILFPFLSSPDYASTWLERMFLE